MRLQKIFLGLGILFSISLAQAQSVTVDVVLNPAGDFTIVPSKVVGFAQEVNGGVMAEKVVVHLKDLQTKVALRDKHVKEKLQVSKYPTVTLLKAVGKNGKGKGVLLVMGKKQEVTGTYTISGDTLKAKFTLHLPNVGIEDISYMGVGVEDDVTVNVELPLKK